MHTTRAVHNRAATTVPSAQQHHATRAVSRHDWRASPRRQACAANTAPRRPLCLITAHHHSPRHRSAHLFPCPAARRSTAARARQTAAVSSGRDALLVRTTVKRSRRPFIQRATSVACAAAETLARRRHELTSLCAARARSHHLPLCAQSQQPLTSPPVGRVDLSPV